MTAAPLWRNRAVRWVIWVALTLACAGGGLAAALAASTSTVVRAVGGAAGAAAALAAATWIDRTLSRADARAAALAVRDQILDPVITPAPAADHTILGLLLATRQHAPAFRGRETDLTWLTTWLNNPDNHPIALITGPGGTGKTRLVTHFAATLPAPWTAGWLHPSTGPGAIAVITACLDPALILIDNADQRPDLPGLLASLAAHRGTPATRAILITRTTATLTPAHDNLLPEHQWILDPTTTPHRELGPFGTTADHSRWLTEATRAYAKARHTPPPDLPSAIPSAPDTPQSTEPILALHARALILVLDSEQNRPTRPPGPPQSPFDQIAQALLSHEQQRWHHTAASPKWQLTGITEPVQDAAIAALALTAVVDSTTADTALQQAIPVLADAPALLRANITRWAFHLYPPPITLQPDLINETFTATQLATNPALTAYTHRLSDEPKTRLLNTLARAADHTAAAAGLYARLAATSPSDLLPVAMTAALSATVGRPTLDERLAALISDDTSPREQLITLRNQAAWQLPRTRAALSTALAHQYRHNGTPSELGGALSLLGGDLRDLGRYDDALQTSQEAAVLWRELAAANPAHQPGLANALSNLGVSLGDVGRDKDALDAAQEAVVLWRELAAANPAHRLGLAPALINLGNDLRDLGRHYDALQLSQEAADLWRELAAANPAHQPSFFRALGNLGNCLTSVGRRLDGLNAAQEAVDMWRELAATQPTYQDDLAFALANISSHLRDLRRSEDALNAAQEAVDMWRELAAANPARRLGLARALGNLGNILGDLGRYHEAFKTMQESLALWRGLATISPAHRDSLALALLITGGDLRNLDRNREALKTTQEAVDLWRELAAASPAHQPGLARAMTNLGNILGAVGRLQDGLDVAQEAVDLWRELAATNPAYQGDLAGALWNCGANLSYLGRRRDALDTCQEAVTLWHELADNDPDLYEERYRHYRAQLDRMADTINSLPDDPADQLRS